MTAIAAVAHRGKVWLAGDSADTTDSGLRRYCVDPKVWIQNGYALGICGDSGSDRALASVDWTPTLNWFHDRCYKAIQIAEEAADLGDWEAIIGFRGKIYFYCAGEINTSGERMSSGAFYQSEDRFAAIGCAEDFLYGYLEAGLTRGADPARLVAEAVKAASRRLDSVGGRVRVVAI